MSKAVDENKQLNASLYQAQNQQVNLFLFSYKYKNKKSHKKETVKIKSNNKL